MPSFAKRITHTSKKSYGMVARAASVPTEGRDLIHLELGQPIHDTPAHIKQAAIKALQDGHVHYSDLQGILPLREAMAEKVRAYNGIDAKASEIIVTNGLTQASFAAFMALLDHDQECILLEPYYPQHVGKIEMAGGRVVLAQLDKEASFAIRRDLIEKHITPKTRMIAIVNPCNPTGRVYTREELQIVADLAIEHDLWVVADEVYEQILFDGAKHVSIASLPGMKERTITMFAFTKAYAMDGWRLGYLVADAHAIPALMKVTTTEVTHVNTFIQHAAIAALKGPPSALEEMVEDDCRKRDLVVSRLNQMPGVTCARPEGTIYAFPDIGGTGLTAQAAAEAILDRADVVVEAGSFYGGAGEHHLRVCFGSQTYERLEEAMDRLSRFFNSL
ncbi:pyridoxal phosphate-dependent aminotransferase [Nitratireductor pacificus]|nr:pyridoxal phosphate-dependent aminotransferase [Nitratireductor pacificus]